MFDKTITVSATELAYVDQLIGQFRQWTPDQGTNVQARYAEDAIAAMARILSR